MYRDTPARHPVPGGPQLPGHRRGRGAGGRPATGHRPGPGPRGHARGPDHPVQDPPAQRLPTGGLALVRETGAAYHVGAADQVAFDRVPVADGDLVEVTPSAWIRVLATPGHTFTHLAYVLADGTGDPVAVFTGGSLPFGATGRTDLLGGAHAGSWPGPSTRRRRGWPPCCPTGSGCCPRTGSAASAPPPRRPAWTPPRSARRRPATRR